MSIRITTDDAIDVKLARERLAVTARHVAAIQKLSPSLPCNHRGGGDLETCLRCAVRTTVRKAVDAVLDTGGRP